MRKNFSLYLMATTLAAGSAALTGSSWADNPIKAGADQVQKNLTNEQNPQMQPADDTTAKEVHKMLSRVINDAYTRGSFDNVVGYLSKEDRDRIGKAASQKYDDLDGRINEFRKDFHAKYSQDFDIKWEHIKDIQVFQGSDKNHVTVSLGTLGSNSMKGAAEKAVNGTATGGDVADAMGRTLTLNLTNEGTLLNAWRIKLPEALTGAQLKDAWLRKLTLFDESKAKWPADVNEAYRQSARQVFDALSTSQMASEK